MATPSAVWGIDVGQCALKAIKLRAAGDGQVEVVAFDVVEHPKILSQPDADRDELIRAALQKFASRNEWQGDKFVVGVPGQQTFARFCKMPPIDLKKDAKKIPDLVRYEASQQIPFDMDDVVWDYQVFTDEHSPDIEVGIFAIRKDLIRKHLGFFSETGIAPTGVQAVPAALYNYCNFDLEPPGDNGAYVIVDVGAQNTDLIIVEPNSAWTRNIPLGGNSFTEALVRSFKLSFAKAESLKRTAADSKYARQIFQAMRPVFAELVAEIQRSLGFYASTHRDTELKRVIALGNAFRLPGLQKYLENNLTIAGGVVKLESFGKLAPTTTVKSPQFSENVLSLAAAYGLALQGLGLGRIHASLLPPELARIAVWRKKRPFFAAAAAVLMVAAAVPWVANALDKQALGSESSNAALRRTREIISKAQKYQDDYRKAAQDNSAQKTDIENIQNLQQAKALLPRLYALAYEAMPPLNPPDLNDVQSGTELREKVASNPAAYERTRRGQLIIESLTIEYVPDVDAVDIGPAVPAGQGDGTQPGGQASPAGGQPGQAGGGFIVRIEGRLVYGRLASDAATWFGEQYFPKLRELGRRPGMGFHLPEYEDRFKRAISDARLRKYHTGEDVRPTGQQPAGPEPARGVRVPDPVTGEEAIDDWAVSFAFRVRLGDAPPPPDQAQQGQPPQ